MKNNKYTYKHYSPNPRKHKQASHYNTYSSKHKEEYENGSFDIPKEKYVYSSIMDEGNDVYRRSTTFNGEECTMMSIRRSMLSRNRSRRRRNGDIGNDGLERSATCVEESKQGSCNSNKSVKFKTKFVEIVDVQNWKELFWEKPQMRIEGMGSKRSVKKRRESEEKCKCVIV